MAAQYSEILRKGGCGKEMLGDVCDTNAVDNLCWEYGLAICYSRNGKCWLVIEKRTGAKNAWSRCDTRKEAEQWVLGFHAGVVDEQRDAPVV